MIGYTLMYLIFFSYWIKGENCIVTMPTYIDADAGKYHVEELSDRICNIFPSVNACNIQPGFFLYNMLRYFVQFNL